MRILLARMMHQKCRQGFYPSSSVQRFDVPESKVSWDIEYSEYKPVEYTAPDLKGKPWADPEIGEDSFTPNWNSLDGKKLHLSFHAEALKKLTASKAIVK